MNGYYDPFPTMVLSRPLLIGGHLGSGTRLIGRSLCARTGLPFVDIDRKIEHEAGLSLAQIAAADGRRRIESWAESMLDRFARQRPWSVIVLDRAWPRRDLQRLLSDRVDFVHVLRAQEYLLDRMRKELYGPANWLLQGEPKEICDPGRWPDTLDAWLARRAPLLDFASVLLDAERLHPHRVAGLLMESLDSVAETQASEAFR